MPLPSWFRRPRRPAHDPMHRPSPDEAVSILRRARRLRFRISPHALDELTGAYHGARTGLGLIFSDLKPYEPGDDVRHIDWNVTARQTRPYVRRFVEERALTVWLVVDVSASLRFGPDRQTKADRATQAAALVATAAARNGDRVGLLLVSDRIEAELLPSSGPRHVARLLRLLVASPASSRASSLRMAPAKIRTNTRKSLIILLSDFLLAESEPAADWARFARSNRVVAFRLIDPREESLPDAGLLNLGDLETGQRRVVDSSSAAVRSAYRALAEARRERFFDWCAEARIEGIDFPTDIDPLTLLLRFFAREPQRRRR